MSSSAVAAVHDAQRTLEHWLSKGEPRVRDWPLMRFETMVAVCLGYLLLVPLLSAAMRRRGRPFSVGWLALLHNVNLTLLSLYMLVEILRQARLRHYSLFGNGVEHGAGGEGMARVLHLFYLSKTLEFLDTAIMALKLSFRQISFLHVYHHASIFAIWWLIVRFAPGGDAYFSAALNSGVHVLMYGYYLWSTFAPRLPAGQRAGPLHPAFYKRGITTLQMTQFALMLVQASYDLLVPNPYPRPCVWILFVYMLSMLALFANFFVHSYGRPGTGKGKKHEE